MSTYKPCIAFSAQHRNITALQLLFAALPVSSEAHEFDRSAVLPTVIFMAFSIESYVNSIGSRKVEFWDDIERLPWKKKLSILHKLAGTRPDWGQDPLQLAQEVFDLRDQLAHGKPEFHFGPPFGTPEEAQNYALQEEVIPPWLTKLSPTWILAARERFISLMEYLGTLHAFGPGDYQLAYSVTVIKAPDADA